MGGPNKGTKAKIPTATRAASRIPRDQQRMNAEVQRNQPGLPIPGHGIQPVHYIPGAQMNQEMLQVPQIPHVEYQPEFHNLQIINPEIPAEIPHVWIPQMTTQQTHHFPGCHVNQQIYQFPQVENQQGFQARAPERNQPIHQIPQVYQQEFQGSGIQQMLQFPQWENQQLHSAPYVGSQQEFQMQSNQAIPRLEYNQYGYQIPVFHHNSHGLQTPRQFDTTVLVQDPTFVQQQQSYEWIPNEHLLHWWPQAQPTFYFPQRGWNVEENIEGEQQGVHTNILLEPTAFGQASCEEPWSAYQGHRHPQRERNVVQTEREQQAQGPGQINHLAEREAQETEQTRTIESDNISSSDNQSHDESIPTVRNSDPELVRVNDNYVVQQSEQTQLGNVIQGVRAKVSEHIWLRKLILECERNQPDARENPGTWQDQFKNVYRVSPANTEEEESEEDWTSPIFPHGLELYEVFKVRHDAAEDDQGCLVLQENDYHLPSVLPRRRKVPLVLVCPLSMHPARLCSWLGFYSDRDKHVTTYHRNRLAQGKTVHLGARSIVVLSAFNELFLCYTLIQQDVLYCVVQHACLCRPCPSAFEYDSELRDANGDGLQRGDVATMFQTFAHLKRSGKCVSPSI